MCEKIWRTKFWIKNPDGCKNKNCNSKEKSDIRYVRKYGEKEFFMKKKADGCKKKISIYMYKKKEKKEKNENSIAEDGFDPSTSGLWAQHAPTAPLCLRDADVK